MLSKHFNIFKCPKSLNSLLHKGLRHFYKILTLLLLSISKILIISRLCLELLFVKKECKNYIVLFRKGVTLTVYTVAYQIDTKKKEALPGADFYLQQICFAIAKIGFQRISFGPIANITTWQFYCQCGNMSI